MRVQRIPTGRPFAFLSRRATESIIFQWWQFNLLKSHHNWLDSIRHYLTNHLLYYNFLSNSPIIILLFLKLYFQCQRTQGENADENEAQLDEEMAKVFAEPNLSKFDVRKLSDVKPPSSSKLDKEYQQSQQAHSDKKYNEQDYDCKSSMSIVDGFDCHLSTRSYHPQRIARNHIRNHMLRSKPREQWFDKRLRRVTQR